MFLQRVIAAIEEAEGAGPDTAIREDVLSGFSGKKIIGTLQRLGRLISGDAGACYLEIGVFQGLTLLSVASSVPELTCFGVDNFAFFDPQSKNLGLVNERKEKLVATNACLINMDYEDALASLDDHLNGKKIALYFVDGPHDYRSQLMCLELALPYLREDCVILVDDSNYRHVRQANRDFLVTHPDFKLLFEAYTERHPANMTEMVNAEARQGWWNGINILVRDPQNRLNAMLPETYRSRLLYENEHITHAAATAEFMTQGADILNALDRLDPLRLIKSLLVAFRALCRTSKQRKGLFRNMNTFSEKLPKAHFNVIRP